MHPSPSSPQSDGHDQGKDDPGSNAGGRSRTTGIAANVSGFFRRVFKNRAFLLFLAFFVLYNLTLQTSYTRDTMPNMYLPLSMIKHGSISLSFFPELYAAGRPYFIVRYDGGMHSIFGIGAPIFALPFYLRFLLFK